MGLTVGFAGLSHLGLCSLAGAARRGFDVVGVHQDRTALQKYRDSGELWVSEPGLREALSTHANQITLDDSLSALVDCDIIYISSDVPTDEKGNSDLDGIDYLLDLVSKIANPNSVVVLLSQVPPGFSRRRNSDFERLYYQVETLIFGNAIDRATFPERLIIGCESKKTDLNKVLGEYLNAFECPLIQMDFESAELAKISINLMLTAHVTVSNILSEVSEQIGADWLDIVPALRLDCRIGEHAYILPGFGITGGNLERDLRTVVNIGKSSEIDVSHIESMIKQSDGRRNWALKKVNSLLGSLKEESVKVGVLGIAYKTGTNSIKNSVGYDLVRKLSALNIDVLWHDPAIFGSGIESIVEWRASSVPECVVNADLIIICTPWDEYRNLDWAQLAIDMRGNKIIDPFRLANFSSKEVKHLDWIVMGKSGLAKSIGS